VTSVSAPQRLSPWRRFRNVAAPRVFVRRHRYDLDEALWICREKLGSILGRAPADETMQSIDLTAIPCKVLVSLERHQERRSHTLRQLAALNIHVDWKIPTKLSDVAWSRIPRIYRIWPSVGSHVVTLLSIMDEVERARAPSFMHIEDDVIFHPRMAMLLPRLRVPRDWRFIYLGGRNAGSRAKVSPGLVRSDLITDLHAVIIRSDMIPELRNILLDPAIRDPHLDSRIAILHKRYPAYLCRPNLAWQSAHSADSGKSPAYSNYYPNGAVKVGQGD
jgi:hypothetical protein